jgi:uncharacterized membrane protein (TIGR02234 family)
MTGTESPARQASPSAGAAASLKREYGIVLLAGALGAVLVLLAVRQRWAQAVFAMPRPLSPEVVNVSGADLVPLAGALALAALAGLAAVIATRGAARRVAGVLLALFGAGAGAAVTTSVTAATVVSVAASKVASPGAAAVSGAAGSTTSGTSGGGALIVSGSAGHAVMTGTPWHVALLIGALLIFLAGLATALRGADWPVMSARYDAPGGRQPGSPAADEAAGAVPIGAVPIGADATGTGATEAGATGASAGARATRAARPADAASMWESLSGGEDPTQ